MATYLNTTLRRILKRIYYAYGYERLEDDSFLPWVYNKAKRIEAVLIKEQSGTALICTILNIPKMRVSRSRLPTGNGYQ